MSVFIKGMEMPQSCKKCGVVSCGLYDAETWGIYRHPDCPLVDVPTPHGRLIDADALIDLWHGCEVSGDIKPIIDARPTVLEEEDE